MISDAVRGVSLGPEVPIVGLAHEAAGLLRGDRESRIPGRIRERLAVPVALRDAEHVDALVERCQRVIEAQMAARFTVAESTALARFYGTPEGRSVTRKTLAFTAAAMPRSSSPRATTIGKV